MEKRCDIIIPVWNQHAFTKDCIDSIFKNTDNSYRLIIIDNASDDETSVYLDSLKDKNGNPPVLVVRNEKNEGFIKAVNKGIGLSDAPYICILNNDTLVTKDWLETMISIMESHDDIGIVNPSSNTLGQRPAQGEPVELYAKELKSQSAKYMELGAAIGFCMLVKRIVIQRIGLFDEIYGMGNFDDTDFSRRAIKEGFLCVRACGAYVYHREKTSFNKVNTFDKDFKRNREIFEFRWGKPKRVLYILDSYDGNILKRLNLEAMKLARSGNWVWYLSKEPVDMPLHSNIRFVQLGEKWFYMKAAFTVLKKKKKFDEIFVGGEKLANFLNSISYFHKARIAYY
ncbi:MAG: glycosyltransferase family 2 protein [Candidatus Omnitrophica bacterium]|nr:glycosyltransferase family 2 protein [Candidatus Omnitrophota bacterium]